MKKMKEMEYNKEIKRELLFQDNYKGYNFYILSLGMFPVAYIEIPESHKFYKKEYYEIYDIAFIDVHGGLTYSEGTLMINKDKVLNGWFIGWDYGHAWDYISYDDDTFFINCKKWSTSEIYEEAKNVIEQIINFNK